jgi:hypothetical protein
MIRYKTKQAFQMVVDPQGYWVKQEDAQAKIDALQQRVAELKSVDVKGLLGARISDLEAEVERLNDERNDVIYDNRAFDNAQRRFLRAESRLADATALLRRWSDSPLIEDDPVANTAQVQAIRAFLDTVPDEIGDYPRKFAARVSQMMASPTAKTPARECDDFWDAVGEIVEKCPIGRPGSVPAAPARTECPNCNDHYLKGQEDAWQLTPTRTEQSKEDRKTYKERACRAESRLEEIAQAIGGHLEEMAELVRQEATK